ncbi:MAG: 16S rRNA (guanine(966)-N(2))-methyltransferase RsmD [Simkaniaceae bacterium]|nr:16S rRNA (guanine(966)-N(2))-methyltransferase RsmD [Simkaniaceae bacterium]
MKITGGIFKGRPLASPKGKGTRPTSAKLRESIFALCADRIEGARFLDLFAGSGAMGLEALSRGARHATFVENRMAALHVIRRNITTLSVRERATVLRADARIALKRSEKHRARFDIIVADPPYENREVTVAILSFLDNSSLLAGAGCFFLETDIAPGSLPPLRTLLRNKERRSGRTLLFLFRRPENRRFPPTTHREDRVLPGTSS